MVFAIDPGISLVDSKLAGVFSFEKISKFNFFADFKIGFETGVAPILGLLEAFAALLLFSFRILWAELCLFLSNKLNLKPTSCLIFSSSTSLFESGDDLFELARLEFIH